jgi:hypothetical protein
LAALVLLVLWKKRNNMAQQKYLTVTLKLLALYSGVMGAFMLLFHDAASFVFQYTVKDPMITRYWGGALLALSLMYLFISMDPEKYRLLIWVAVFELGMTMILTLIHVSLASISWVQGITGLILNPLFVIVLLYGLAKKPEGEVLFVAGEAKKAKPEHELPPHISGKHPLHRK